MREQDKALARAVQRLFASPTMRVSTSGDVIGVEVCGALKNVLAIAAGIVEGLDLGSNAMAALISQARNATCCAPLCLPAFPAPCFAALCLISELGATCMAWLCLASAIVCSPCSTPSLPACIYACAPRAPRLWPATQLCHGT